MKLSKVVKWYCQKHFCEIAIYWLNYKNSSTDHQQYIYIPFYNFRQFQNLSLELYAYRLFHRPSTMYLLLRRNPINGDYLSHYLVKWWQICSVVWHPLSSVGGLIDGLSTVSVDSLYSTLKVVMRSIDTKHKKDDFKQ